MRNDNIHALFQYKYTASSYGTFDLFSKTSICDILNTNMYQNFLCGRCRFSKAAHQLHLTQSADFLILKVKLYCNSNSDVRLYRANLQRQAL